MLFITISHKEEIEGFNLQEDINLSNLTGNQKYKDKGIFNLIAYITKKKNYFIPFCKYDNKWYKNKKITDNIGFKFSKINNNKINIKVIPTLLIYKNTLKLYPPFCQ